MKHLLLLGLVLSFGVTSCSKKILYNKFYFYFDEKNKFNNDYTLKFLNDSLFVIYAGYYQMDLIDPLCNIGRWKCSGNKIFLETLQPKTKIELKRVSLSKEKNSISTVIIQTDSLKQISPSYFCFSNGIIMPRFSLDYHKVLKSKLISFKIDSFYISNDIDVRFGKNEILNTKSDVFFTNKSDTISITTLIDTCNSKQIFSKLIIFKRDIDTIPFRTKMLSKKIKRLNPNWYREKR